MSDLTTKDALLERAVAALEKLKNGIDIINPVGVVQAFAGNTVPDGWLVCDGSAVSRTDYANLYAVIGDTYGAGDGVDTFNIPDLADKFIEGSATSGTVKSAGLPNITGSVQVAPEGIGSCPHTSYNGALAKMGTSGIYKYTHSGSDTADWGISLDASRSSSIYGNSTTVQPPSLTMQYIIKY